MVDVTKYDVPRTWMLISERTKINEQEAEIKEEHQLL